VKVLANQDVYGSDCLRPCGITKTILPNVARPGHPTSSFYRMSKSVKGIEARRAQTKMTSESMMRLISNLLLRLALFVQARFAQLLSSIVELRKKA